MESFLRTVRHIGSYLGFACALAEALKKIAPG